MALEQTQLLGGRLLGCGLGVRLRLWSAGLDQSREAPEVRLDYATQPGVVECCGRVVHRVYHQAVPSLRFAPGLADGVFRKELPEGVPAQRDHDLGCYHLDLSVQVGTTGTDLAGERVPVVGSPALDHVGYVYVFPLQVDGRKQFVQEVAGGALLGLALGGLAFWMLRRMDDHQVEILVTLAVVLGGYQLALVLHASGPIAMVIAGLLVGNHGRLFAMSDTTRAHLDTFWEIVDEILNTVLFVMIGLEMIHITLDGRYLLAGVCAIPLVLITRYGCVSMALQLVRPWHRLGDNASALLTWAGLRGGISVALALALPPGEARDTILTITYCVVLFSIVVQGLSVGRVIRRLNRDL